MLLPIAIAANAVPIIAFAPIFNVWFNPLSPHSKMAIAAVLCFFPVLVNTLRGLQSVRPSQIELMRSYAASELEIFRRVRVPTALPYVFTALKVASVLAMIGAVVGEYFGGSFKALGVLIRSDAQIFNFERAWAGDRGRVAARPRALPRRRAPPSARSSAGRPPTGLLDDRPTNRQQNPRNARPEHERGGRMNRRWVKWLVVAGALVALAVGAGASAAPQRAQADKVTLQLKWVPQAQFAGYYAALKKGYYKKAGLDVTIKPGGPDIIPEQVVASGQAQFGIDWLPSLLAARDKGTDLVNIAQVFARSGMTQLTWKDSGITRSRR